MPEYISTNRARQILCDNGLPLADLSGVKMFFNLVAGEDRPHTPKIWDYKRDFLILLEKYKEKKHDQAVAA